MQFIRLQSRLVFVVVMVTLVVFTSCHKDDDYFLSESLFVEDPYAPGLPIYSEWGYNTFGAYIDRSPFVSNHTDVPVNIYVTTDTLHMILRGTLNDLPATLTLSIQGYDPASHLALNVLDSTLINLKDPGQSATLKVGNTTTHLTIIEGELFFKKVQRLYVDEEATRTIMAGLFQLKTFINNEPTAISSGRFDLGVGYNNFFSF